jgi:hypothetical protein
LLPLIFSLKYSGRKDYSQGKTRTQGKIAKKGRKNDVFRLGMWKSPPKTRLERIQKGRVKRRKGDFQFNSSVNGHE